MFLSCNILHYNSFETSACNQKGGGTGTWRWLFASESWFVSSGEATVPVFRSGRCLFFPREPSYAENKILRLLPVKEWVWAAARERGWMRRAAFLWLKTELILYGPLWSRCHGNNSWFVFKRQCRSQSLRLVVEQSSFGIVSLLGKKSLVICRSRLFGWWLLERKIFSSAWCYWWQEAPLWDAGSPHSLLIQVCQMLLL